MECPNDGYDKVLKQVVEAAGGALAVPLRKAAQILGLSPRTLYNRHNQKRLPVGLSPLKAFEPRLFFHVNGIARALYLAQQPTPARGAPSKAERIAAHANGMGIKEYRKHKKGR